MPRLQFSSESLLFLKSKPCLCLPRKVKRKLKYFRIFVDHIKVAHAPRIPGPLFLHDEPRVRCLTEIKREPQEKKRKSRRKAVQPSVLLSNVRSLPGKVDEIMLLVSQLNPNVCVFTETWLNHDIPDTSIALDNYFIIRKDRDSAGGGLICYLSDAYLCENVRIITPSDVPSINDCGSELLPIIVGRLLIIVVYHPHWNDSVMHLKCIDCLIEIIDFSFTTLLDVHNSNVIICGDFNDLRKCYDEIASLSSTKPVVHVPTRGLNTLDQIFTSFLHHVPAQISAPIGSSDHCTVFWNPSNTGAKNVTFKKKVRKLTKSNTARFANLVCSTDWLSLLKSFDDVNDAAYHFQNSLFSIFDHCFPERIIRRRSNNPEWVKDSLRLLIDERDRAFSKKQFSKYYRLRKEVSSHIYYLKKVFLHKSSSSQNSKDLWKSLKLLAKLPNTSHINDFSPDDFLTYFSSVFNPSSSLLPHPPAASAISQSASQSISLSLTDVFRHVNKLKRHSCGSDGLPGWVFKDFIDFLAPSILYLFNWCLSSNTFPRCFKMANIHPIPKVNRPNSVSHFRPISLLPSLSKLFERIIVSDLLLPSIRDRVQTSQFAFIPRPGSGTTCALILAQNKILSFLDKSSGAVRVLSADLSKAFDKVPHHLILEACNRFHLPSNTSLLISSFLSDRVQRVHLNGRFSDWCSVSSGVPQGSVLGPILFTMAIDNFTPVCPNSTAIIYADDILLLHFVRSSADDALQDEWDNLVAWSTALSIPINEEKSHVMNIVTRSNLNLPPISTSSISYLSVVHSMTFLGVIFSDDLKWNLHVDHTVRKASKRLFILRNLRKAGCSPTLMTRCYTSFIRSLLAYSFPAFCNLPDFLFKKLVRIERRSLRIVGCSSFCVDLSAFVNNASHKIFSSISRNTQHPLRSMFDSSHSRLTRSSNNLKPPFAKTKRFSTSFIKFCLSHNV